MDIIELFVNYFYKIFAFYIFIFNCSRNSAMPLELKSSKIIQNSINLNKELVVNVYNVGDVTDIIEKKVYQISPLEIGVAGTGGAIFFDANYNIKNQIFFKNRLGRVSIIDGNNTQYEFLNHGAWTIPNSLIDYKGTILWQNYRDDINDTGSGDIDSDGVLDFVVGYNGDGGVALYNHTGGLIWNKPDGNVWDVEIIDVNQDGISEIVHSNAEGLIVIRDSNGEIIKKFKSQSGYLSKFSLCKWPSLSDRKYIMCENNGFLWIIDYNEKTVVKYGLDYYGKYSSYNVFGTPIQFNNNLPIYFAAIVMYKTSWHRSMLYIFDSNKNIVYEELLPEISQSIVAFKINTTDRELLLVGGEGKVWQYSVE